MAKANKSKDDAIVIKTVAKVKEGGAKSPSETYVFTRDIMIFVSIIPKDKRFFKVGDEIKDPALVARLQGVLPIPIKLKK